MLRLTRSRVSIGGAALVVALATAAPAAAIVPAAVLRPARSSRPARAPSRPARAPSRPARAPSDPDFEAASRAEQAAVDAVTLARTRREAAEADVRRLD